MCMYMVFEGHDCCDFVLTEEEFVSELFISSKWSQESGRQFCHRLCSKCGIAGGHSCSHNTRVRTARGFTISAFQIHGTVFPVNFFLVCCGRLIPVAQSQTTGYPTATNMFQAEFFSSCQTLFSIFPVSFFRSLSSQY